MTSKHLSKVVRFHTQHPVTSTGIVGDDPFILHGEARLRISVVDVGLTNSIKLQVRLTDEIDFVDLATITGEDSVVVDVSTYDEVRFNVVTYGGTPGTITASGFFSTVIDEPVTIDGSVTGSFTPVGLTVGGIITQVSLTDAAWTAIPPSVLLNRNSITVQNISGNGGVVLWNYTASAAATHGFRIEDGGFKSVAIRDTIIVYARMLSGTGKVVVDEVA